MPRQPERPRGWNPLSVWLAKGAVGLVAAMCGGIAVLWGYALLSILTDAGNPNLRPWTALLPEVAGSAALAGAGAWLALRLGAGRRTARVCSLLYTASVTAVLGWFFWGMAVAPAPEGMASFVAIVIGGPLVLFCLACVLTLLWPGVAAHCWRRPDAARTSH